MLSVDIYGYLRLPGIHARVSGVAAEKRRARPNSRKQLSGKQKAEECRRWNQKDEERERVNLRSQTSLGEHQCLAHTVSRVNELGMSSNLLGGLEKFCLQKLSQLTGVVLLVKYQSPLLSSGARPLLFRFTLSTQPSFRS
jgi:hypothetical protein